MPAYNAERYIREAINSVLNQSHRDWELLIIDDGSTDQTGQIVKSYPDPRVRYFEQPNKGVSSARNLGLSKMKGDYFCFLDADDIYPVDSIISRLEVFEHSPQVMFVDGRVEYINAKGTPTGRHFLPRFKGLPKKKLIRLSSSCFFGPSWMIKREPGVNYEFDSSMTHCEDLSFYISIADRGHYDYTESCVLHYRTHDLSAMTRLDSLEKGYTMLVKKVVRECSPVFLLDQLYLRFKAAKIMLLSHSFIGKQPVKGIRAFFRLLFA